MSIFRWPRRRRFSTNETSTSPVTDPVTASIDEVSSIASVGKHLQQPANWSRRSLTLFRMKCMQTLQPSKSTRKMREEMLNPLRVALTEAIMRHTKATGVREALEAEVGAKAARLQTVHAAIG